MNVETEVSENTPQQKAEETKQESVSRETETTVKPRNGYEGDNFVEFTPEQQKRLNAITKKAGKAEREAEQLRTIAQQQFEVIEELRKGQSQIVSHLQETDFTKTESQLKSQRKEAYDRGDLLAVDDINDKLAEMKIQRKISEIQQKQQVKTHQGVNGNDVVTRAIQQGSITEADAEVYRAWANEEDEFGNLIRPWVNERDRRNLAAASEGRAVFSNPTYVNKPFSEKLKEIDRRMGIANQQAGSNVLPAGNLTRGSKSNTIRLTPYQEHVAVKTRFAGPGKSPQDHIEAYKAQVVAVKGTRK